MIHPGPKASTAKEGGNGRVKTARYKMIVTESCHLLYAYIYLCGANLSQVLVILRALYPRRFVHSPKTIFIYVRTYVRTARASQIDR